jgi:hypothetical protein
LLDLPGISTNPPRKLQGTGGSLSPLKKTLLNLLRRRTALMIWLMMKKLARLLLRNKEKCLKGLKLKLLKLKKLLLKEGPRRDMTEILLMLKSKLRLNHLRRSSLVLQSTKVRLRSLLLRVVLMLKVYHLRPLPFLKHKLSLFNLPNLNNQMKPSNL